MFFAFSIIISFTVLVTCSPIIREVKADRRPAMRLSRRKRKRNTTKNKSPLSTKDSICIPAFRSVRSVCRVLISCFEISEVMTGTRPWVIATNIIQIKINGLLFQTKEKEYINLLKVARIFSKIFFMIGYRRGKDCVAFLSMYFTIILYQTIVNVKHIWGNTCKTKVELYLDNTI